jgi:hypothetical protein
LEYCFRRKFLSSHCIAILILWVFLCTVKLLSPVSLTSPAVPPWIFMLGNIRPSVFNRMKTLLFIEWQVKTFRSFNYHCDKNVIDLNYQWSTGFHDLKRNLTLWVMYTLAW